MSVSTLTAKGQTTIPKDIREGLGVEPGDQIHFSRLSNGTVVMRARKRSILDLHGAFPAPGGKIASIDEMKAGRSKS
ncbi:MAG TPA: type II toxin-antitoxin system PrlF family antitoxin [Parvibaculum sp.]|jgi:AbrB family looped-hinge helix DNA binding protein